MPTSSEQMLLKALVDYCRGDRKSFRNRHLAQLSGIPKQNINNYLRKWQRNGYIGKNPLVTGEWILLDLNGLIADLVDPTEPTKMGHAKHELFNKEVLTRLHNLTELYAALRILKAAPPDLKSNIEQYINAAINELRNERTFMHVKQYSLDRARQTVRKHEVLAGEMGIDIEEVAPIQKQGLTLVPPLDEDGEDTEETKESDEIIQARGIIRLKDIWPNDSDVAHAYEVLKANGIEAE